MLSCVIPLAAGLLLFASFMGSAMAFFEFKFHLFLLHVGPMALVTFALLPASLALIQNKSTAVGKARAWFAKWHGIFNLLSVLAVVVAVVAIVLNKERMAKLHLSSNHSWAGAAAAAFMLANAAGGALKLCSKGSWLWHDDLHRYSGMLAVQLAWGAALSGLYSTWGHSALGGAAGVNNVVLGLCAVVALTLGAGRWRAAWAACSLRCGRGGGRGGDTAHGGGVAQR